jgi:hypothetical protein
MVSKINHVPYLFIPVYPMWIWRGIPVAIRLWCAPSIGAL